MRKMMVKLDNSPYPNSIWFTNSEILFNRKRTELTGSEPILHPGSGICSRTNDFGSIVVGVFDGQAITTVHEISHAVINVFEYVWIEVKTGLQKHLRICMKASVIRPYGIKRSGTNETNP